jgi:hypothetical protein
MNESAEPTMVSKHEKGWSRREFARDMMVGWGSLCVMAGISAVGLMRFLLPNVLYEPSTVFRVGLPKSYPIPFMPSRRSVPTCVVRCVTGGADFTVPVTAAVSTSTATCSEGRRPGPWIGLRSPWQRQGRSGSTRSEK